MLDNRKNISYLEFMPIFNHSYSLWFIVKLRMEGSSVHRYLEVSPSVVTAI